MAKKIILFLSTLRNNPEEISYICPDKEIETGSQTNEAPVKYLLRTWPDINEILCIVTPEAKDIAWEWFQDTVTSIAPNVLISEIPYETGKDFSDGPMQELIKHIGQGDEILLETTGGFRHNVMEMLLISRVLSYIGVRTVAAVYASLKPAEITDATHLIREFDLVGGMQEFASFGSTRTLREYYGSPAKDPRIEDLLCSLEQLLNCITLCRTNQLENLLTEFADALAKAEHCDDSLMHILLPAFRKKFGSSMNDLSVIRWCCSNDMIQQAVTIYKERIPAYLLKERKDLFKLKQGARQGNPKEYESPEETKLVAQFKDSYIGRRYYEPYEGESVDYSSYLLEHLEEWLPESNIEAVSSVKQVKTVFMDYFYIRTLRNILNHAGDTVTEYAKHMEEVLTKAGYPPFAELTTKSVAEILLNALEHMKKENYKP